MSEFPNKRRVAIVTGASAGIGRACAKALVSCGVDVLGVARREPEIDEKDRQRDSCGKIGRFVALAADVTEPNSPSLAWEEARRHFGINPTIWIVNAGRGLPGTILESDQAGWAEMFELNCLAALRQLREAGQRFKPMPHDTVRDIVVLGSVVGRNVSPFNPVYGVSKFALHSAAESLRQELAPHRVRVTLIEPGTVRSDFQATARYNLKAFDDYEDTIGPYLTPEDISELVCFAISRPGAVSLANIVVRPTRQVMP
jgi:NADP-dependent 3-hydroxy acid dehydrogenase YdfG